MQTQTQSRGARGPFKFYFPHTFSTLYRSLLLILFFLIVRVAEESKGRIVVDNSLSLVVSRSHSLSPHIASVCQEAKETTFAPEQLLKEYLDGVVGFKKDSKRDVNSYLSFNEKYSGMDLLLRPGFYMAYLEGKFK